MPVFMKFTARRKDKLPPLIDTSITLTNGGEI